MPTVFHPALKGPEGRVLHRKFGPRGLIKYDRALSGSRSRDHAPNGPAHHRSGPARPWRLGLTLRFGSQPLLRLRAFTLLRARRPGFPPRASKASRAVEPDVDHPTRSLLARHGRPRAVAPRIAETAAPSNSRPSAAAAQIRWLRQRPAPGGTNTPTRSSDCNRRRPATARRPSPACRTLGRHRPARWVGSRAATPPPLTAAPG